MKYNLLKKAYKINFDKIRDGYTASEVSCVANSRSKAKSILLKKIRWDDWVIRYSDDIITFLNIPVIRYPEADQYEFEGQSLSIYSINYILNERVRLIELNKILENPLITYCYIIKRGYYYRPNYCGYTERITEAGIYDKSDAIESAKSCRELSIHPIDIEEHNNIIQSKIKELNLLLI